jgi:hypothetical protein
MSDSFVLTQPYKKSGSLLDHAKSESELSALLVAQFRKAPTLRAAAREMMAEALAGISPFPNPDAFFIHRNNNGGADASPLCLTDALLGVLLGNTEHLNHDQAVVSTRRDSAHASYGWPGLDIAVVRGIFPELVKKLPGFYKFMLDKYWEIDEQTFTQIPGEDPVQGSRMDTFPTFQSWVFCSAIRLGAGKSDLQNRDGARLLDTVDNPECNGRYSLALRTAQGAVLSLSGIYVATAREVEVIPREGDGPESGVYLFSPAGGVERFSGARALETALRQRLEEDEFRQVLLGYLSLEHQVLISDHAADLLQFDYLPLIEKPATRFIADLREKQMNDFDYLLTHAPMSNEAPGVLLQMVDDASRLDDVEQALNMRYLNLLELIQERQMPEWLRFAAPSDRQRYDLLADEQGRCEERMQAQLKGIESLEVYARKEIETYLMRKLGYAFDPAIVKVRLPDEMAFTDAPFKAIYQGTLLQFAMGGMPNVALELAPTIEVPTAYSHPRLNFKFVSTLVQSLDLKNRYGQEVERRYRARAMENNMAALRVSNIALSAWAAKLQGHLSDRGLALIERARSNHGVGGAEMPLVAVGGLYLKSGGRRFEDPVVINEVNGDEEFYVLYAPGHPGGREMFDFHSWHKLSMEVGSWTKTPAGAQYMLDQTVVNPDEHIVPYFESIRMKPSQWSVDSVRFFEVRGAFLQQALASLGHHKIGQMLARNQIFSFTQKAHIADEHKIDTVLLDHRIAALEEAYAGFNIIPWRVAARRECGALIGRHLKASGVPGFIDPDTVFIDLEGNVREGELDLGRYSNLYCLTDLFMVGYSEEDYVFNLGATVYSSIGQDVSTLSAVFIDEMIRGSNYADEYIIELRKHIWGLTNSPPARPRTIVARKINYELRRDAFIAFSQRRLTADEYRWLVQMAIRLDDSMDAKAVAAPGTFHQLLMERKTLLDIFVFKPDKAHAHLPTRVYTPGAPDGQLFRTPSDIVPSVQRPGMSRYYYDRVYYGAQRIIGTLMQKLEVSPIVDGKPYEVAYSQRIFGFEALHDANIRHLILDIDAQTESVNERRLLNTYKFVRRYGDYLAGLHPITKLVWTAIHASVDLFRGIYAYQDGDRARARGYLLKAALGAFKTAKQLRAIRKADKLKRLAKAQNNGAALARS